MISNILVTWYFLSPKENLDHIIYIQYFFITHLVRLLSRLNTDKPKTYIYRILERLRNIY